MNRLRDGYKLALCVVVILVIAATAFGAVPAPAAPAGMTNLVRGKRYTVTSLVSIKYSFAPDETAHQLPGALTDGRMAASTDYHDPQWQEFVRGGARSVVVDLGRIDTVHQMQADFLHNAPAGICFPRHVTYALSLNGKDWAKVGTVDSATPLTSPVVARQTYVLSGLNYRARFVRMTFPVDVLVFVDEFQVFGDKGIRGGATLPSISTPPVYPNAYCPPSSPGVGGIRNMVLIPNGCYRANPAIEKNTVEQLTPYVGFVSASGKITDFMFDGVLFSPYGTAPSGGNYGANPEKPTVMSDWTYYLDNTFDPTSNLAALNIATGNVKSILHQPAYKVKVEIAIPYPTPTATHFGDVDGDGLSENLAALSAREKVLKWYVDQVTSRWDSANYTNLELVGFYWFSEKAAFTVDDHEAAMLRYVGNYVRSLGKVLDWIPFLDAEGFAEWHSLGFDAAEMQPNYTFGNYPEPELGEAADTCKKLGMGIEIEIHWNALTDSRLRAKYYAYLNWGVAKGYMQGAAHSFYQNSGPGTFYQCCISTNPAIREIYDHTCEFIKGTYTDQRRQKVWRTKGTYSKTAPN